MNKNKIAVTVTNFYGSRHYFLNASIKRNLIMTLSGLMLIFGGSFAFNYFQFEQSKQLVAQKSALNQQLIAFDRANSSLNKQIKQHESRAREISRALVEIEKSSGVDTADTQIPLAERVAMIGEFYSLREREYSQLDDKVEHIEGLIGLDDESETSKNPMATRVDMISLTASQERILHDSIPSGFPTNLQVITSSFGMRKHPVTKVESFHKGVDMRAKSGAQIYATADGFVQAANYSKLSGNNIELVHNFGFETRYSHLSEMFVEPGEAVHKGDLIGLSGNTGLTSAPHLHYEIRYLRKSIDPAYFLDWEFGSHEIFSQVRGIQWPSLLSLINKQITHQTLQLSQLDPISPVK